MDAAPRKRGLNGPNHLLNPAHPAFSQFSSTCGRQQALAKKGLKTLGSVTKSCNRRISHVLYDVMLYHTHITRIVNNISYI